MSHLYAFVLCLVLCFAEAALAQSSSSSPTCAATLTASYPAPSVAAGYEVRLVAQKLTAPRGIIFDTAGNLLVVQQGKGVASLAFSDSVGGTCVGSATYKDVILDSTVSKWSISLDQLRLSSTHSDQLNHGIELSPDGKTLYASSPEAAYSWSYDAATKSNTSAPTVLVAGMTTEDHTTRTLLLSRKVNGMLLISRGSTSNLDLLAEDVTSGHSQVKAFNLLNATRPYNYDTDGLRLGWGLRNEVGVAEEPLTGGIYGVENSVDQMTRSGVDIHEDNPGEELNFFGYLNGTRSPQQGMNFGYPSCFAAWDVGSIPNNTGLQVGTQFAIGDQNATINDTYCKQDTVAPRLTFQAHMAPLDIKFNANGTTAWISFHGSW